jgi:hypothetical protein
MPIEMHPVDSASNILAFGYDPDTSTLRIRFKGYKRSRDNVEVPPRTWEYVGVEPHHYEAMRKPGASVGRYFHTYVKSNKGYTATPVGDDA